MRDNVLYFLYRMVWYISSYWFWFSKQPWLIQWACWYQMQGTHMCSLHYNECTIFRSRPWTSCAPYTTVFVAIFGSLAFTWLPQRRECPSIADVTGHLFPLPVPSPGHWIFWPSGYHVSVALPLKALIPLPIWPLHGDICTLPYI